MMPEEVKKFDVSNPSHSGRAGCKADGEGDLPLTQGEVPQSGGEG